jgi:hypothetical protein
MDKDQLKVLEYEVLAVVGAFDNMINVIKRVNARVKQLSLSLSELEAKLQELEMKGPAEMVGPDDQLKIESEYSEDEELIDPNTWWKILDDQLMSKS